MVGLLVLAEATEHGARGLLRLSWAWGLLMLAGLLAAIALAASLRHGRRLTHAPTPRPKRGGAAALDPWKESARRLRPDDPSAPRERGGA